VLIFVSSKTFDIVHVIQARVPHGLARARLVRGPTARRREKLCRPIQASTTGSPRNWHSRRHGLSTGDLGPLLVRFEIEAVWLLKPPTPNGSVRTLREQLEHETLSAANARGATLSAAIKGLVLGIWTRRNCASFGERGGT
jgi:hypothetical protein